MKNVTIIYRIFFGLLRYETYPINYNCVSYFSISICIYYYVLRNLFNMLVVLLSVKNSSGTTFNFCVTILESYVYIVSIKSVI